VLGELDFREMILVVNHEHLRLRLALLGCLQNHENPLLQIFLDPILLVELVFLLSAIIFLVLLFVFRRSRKVFDSQHFEQSTLGCILEVTVEGVVPDLNKGQADVSIIVDPHLDLIELLKLSVNLLESGLFE
jgi:hypothetical protein